MRTTIGCLSRNFMPKNKIIYKLIQAISGWEGFVDENVEVLDLKHSFFAITRLLISFIIFNTVLFLPLLIFKISNNFKFQINLEITIFFAIWVIYGGRFGKRELRWYQIGFSLFCVISLIYFSYASAVFGLYHL